MFTNKQDTASSILSKLYKINDLDSFNNYSSRYLGNVGWNSETKKYVNGPFEIDFISELEYDDSCSAIKLQKTDYNLLDFKYKTNTFGFRGDWDLNYIPENSIAVFGCSFTFGIGCSEQDLWITKLANNLNCKVYNFGVAGSSLEHSCLIYLILSKFVKFSKIVILVPSMTRFFYPNEVKDYFKLENFISEFKCRDIQTEVLRENLYDVLDTLYFQHKLLFNIEQILNVSKLSNAQVYLSSWDNITYKFIKDVFSERVTVLPFFRHNVGKYFGRDGGHAGKETNKYYGDLYSDIIVSSHSKGLS